MAKWKPGGPGRPPANIRKRKAAKRGRPRKNAAARALGRRGGRAGTAKQHAARKRNAVRAGRPRKICIFCSEPVKGGHKDPRLDESCGRHAFVYRQHTEGGPVITRLEVLTEIAALQRLYERIPEDAPESSTVAEEPAAPFDPFRPGPDTVVHDHRAPEAQPEPPTPVPF
jgi:hypothetical protein